MTSLITEGSGLAPVDASGASAFVWLLIALPLLGAAVLLLGGRRTDKFGPLLATALSWGSFPSASRSSRTSSACPPRSGRST